MSSEDSPCFEKSIMNFLFPHCLQVKYSFPTPNYVCTYTHTSIHTCFLSHTLYPLTCFMSVYYLSIYLSIYLIYLSSVSLPLIHSQVISLKSSTRKHITRQCSPETFKFPSQVPLLGGKLGGGLISKSCLTLATPWIVACQDPMSIGFSRQEY